MSSGWNRSSAERAVSYAAWFLAGSVVFATFAIVRFFIVGESHDRQGPDRYAEENLTRLRNDPLTNIVSDGFKVTSQRENISNYLCVVCDFFPTGIDQSFETTAKPSHASPLSNERPSVRGGK